MQELIPKSISFHRANSTFSKLVLNGEVTLQRPVGKRVNRKDNILLTFKDGNLTRGDNQNEYIFTENDKPAKAIPYKMVKFSSQEDKDIITDI